MKIVHFLKAHKKTGLICFFVLAYGFLLWGKFYSLISLDEILPGNDTLGHFWAWREFHEAMSAGHFWNYSIYWFGGIPTTQFYPPLGFILMSGFYALFSNFISQFLVFRFFVFLTFAIFPLPFYFFVKNYLGERAAYFSLPVGLLFVFYTPLMNFMGLGAASSVITGLFNQILAINFLLLYLIALKKIIDAKKFSVGLVIWAGLSLALVFLSHTLTSIMAGVLTGIIGIFYYRRWFKDKLFYNLSATIILGFSLSAFWLWPFIVNLRFTSAEKIESSAFLSSVLNVFLPFHLNNIWQGGWLTFPYIWLVVFLAFLGGLATLLKEKQYLLPFIFFILFFLFGLDYINPIFPGLTLHYYRLLGYDILFYLAISTVGLVAAWDWAKKRRGLLGGSILIGVLILSQYLYFFNLTSSAQTDVDEVMPVSEMTNISYSWSLSEFTNFSDANLVVSDLQSPLLPEAPIRIMPEMSPSLTGSLSSIHFFNTALPLANSQSSLFGLYAESSWQLPFIFPTSNLITGNGMRWGRVKDLTFNSYFQSQDVASMVRRLQLFGVNYLVTGSDYFDEQATKMPDGRLVKSDGKFKIYHLRGAKPFIYAADHIPGLFVRHSGLSFRDFALGWYSSSELLDYPVAEWTEEISRLTREEVSSFSFIVVELEAKPDNNFIEKISSLGKPVIFLNESKQSFNLSGPDTWEIDNFQSIALLQNNSLQMTQPNVESLETLTEFIEKYALSNEFASSTPAISNFSGKQISFSADGPYIINLGYFPYWQNTGEGKVYPVTPGQMLVFANSHTNLEYRAGADVSTGKWLSIIAMISVLYFFIYKKIK